MASVFNYILYLSAAALMFVFALALVAKFQPYKHKKSNTVDIIMLVIMITNFISSSMYYVGRFMYPKWLMPTIVGISFFIVLSYLVFLILSCVLPQALQCCKKCKLLLRSKMKMSEENRALLNHDST
jgi:tellurite resistance protein TehA-like permease